MAEVRRILIRCGIRFKAKDRSLRQLLQGNAFQMQELPKAAIFVLCQLQLPVAIAETQQIQHTIQPQR